ncbi:hypothetical protein ACHAW6_001808 [Cyclotella cf. meneghiniana]
MSKLKVRHHVVDQKVLNNEVSQEFHHVITEDWKATFLLVPPDVQCHYVTEQGIQTFKAHFLGILAGLSPTFSNYLWDKLLPQAELTFNPLCQSTIAPAMSAWKHYNVHFNFEATPLGPIGCPLIIHNKLST